ncbi:hypothetical protein TRFO_10493 [Tritrichomonas foetus]|uniref:Uncharacterized protein n=1 Tax=Tritrichomonas foetus TaxID=1144522 RepID=A0A1J4J8W8_9EUKA|nr:hypothetical protein TRFO_10493 [Tritrichomonas foetus]|eukprot:OHS95584.1 hypothetical protein TRFO_10493 [Tritrichomonas foetus]
MKPAARRMPATPTPQNKTARSSQKAQIQKMKQRIAELSADLKNDQLFYRTYGLSFFSQINLDVPPSQEEADRLTKQQTTHVVCPICAQTRIPGIWKQFYRGLRKQKVQENKNAFMIQNVWKRANGKTESFTPPDLNLFFKLSLEDYQNAELTALNEMADEILHDSVDLVIGNIIVNDNKDSYSEDDNFREEEEEEEEEAED